MTKPLNIAFIKAGWHADIVDQAQVGFEQEMKVENRIFHLDVIKVPGALEMPLVALKLAKTGKYDGIVAVALVVNGGIYRHDFVAQAVVDGLVRAGMDSGVPVFSVSLTPHEFQECPDHIDFFTKHFVKKGAEVARAVMIMADLNV